VTEKSVSDTKVSRQNRALKIREKFFAFPEIDSRSMLTRQSTAEMNGIKNRRVTLISWAFFPDQKEKCSLQINGLLFISRLSYQAARHLGQCRDRRLRPGR
jgi:hypothetical protein